MTTKTASMNRGIVFLTAQLFFSFALALAFHSSAWAGEDLSTLREKAEAGDPKAQKSLGLLYYNGQGVPKDYEKALHWWRLAARQGNAKAQANLGILYYNGQGVTQDYAKSAHWDRLAARQGNAPAQVVLGFLYEKGQGVPQDFGKAASWYCLAAKQGLAQAQFDLGVLYANGQGVPQDFGKAASWYRLAANQGLAQSQFNLGVLYEKGQGVPQDFGKAASWYRLAAKQGLAQGQFNLGILYAKGQGVPQNYSRAYKWLTLAKAAGETSASRLLDLLMPRMTQDQVAEGQRLAEEWTAMKKGSAPTTEAQSSNDGQGIESQVSNTKIAKEIAALNQKLATLTKTPTLPKMPTYHSSVDHPDYRSPRHPNAFALVIGVEKYPGGIPKAEFADRDAQAMVAHLRALGVPLRHIKRLTDETATGNRIKGALHWLKRNVRPGSTVYVYFSGHGSPSQGGTAYLVPFDGDPSDLSDTGVSTSGFYRTLGQLPARHIIVALDACFTGEGKRSIVGSGIRPLVTKIREGEVPSSGKIVVLTAARSNQESGVLEAKGHGLFTYYFLKGLNGGAEHGGHVTVAGLYRYIKPKVESEANLDNRSQTPELEPRSLNQAASVSIR